MAEATIIRNENLARRFLQQHLADGRIEFGMLGGAQVASFLLPESERVSVGSAKGRVAELRSLLKFVCARVDAAFDDHGGPPVAGWRDTGIPKALPVGHVQRLMDSCDRDDPVQARDYAILMLVARLGLRSIEVARLKLGDIDWRGGRIILRGKASREDGMPLPADVGQALADYPRRRSASDLVALGVHLLQGTAAGNQARPGQRRDAPRMRSSPAGSQRTTPPCKPLGQQLTRRRGQCSRSQPGAAPTLITRRNFPAENDLLVLTWTDLNSHLNFCGADKLLTG